ncbi:MULTISPECIES: hypothetical protein [unclassified Halorhabdus]|uniref:DUF7315 family membrane protein n=1 Tax=unclassified Halorhabdus TaxID=2621901 RepID=UPI0018A6B9C2|nr:MULTISPECIES: hypothetical protein [unclassified Halorhabdus]
MSYATHSNASAESTSEETATENETVGPEDTTAGRRDVVVPLRVYKAVSVFSTLFAILAIVVGFVTLDAATNRGTADLAAVDPLVALVGLGVMVLGAVVYAFSTRFRTAGMGPDGGETDG